VPHQVLRRGWHNPILLQTMIRGVSQGVKMVVPKDFRYLDASPSQAMAEGLSLWENAAKTDPPVPGASLPDAF
jgi:hypothetical protein